MNNIILGKMISATVSIKITGVSPVDGEQLANISATLTILNQTAVPNPNQPDYFEIVGTQTMSYIIVRVDLGTTVQVSYVLDPSSIPDPSSPAFTLLGLNFDPPPPIGSFPVFMVTGKDGLALSVDNQTIVLPPSSLTVLDSIDKDTPTIYPYTIILESNTGTLGIFDPAIINEPTGN